MNKQIVSLMLGISISLISFAQQVTLSPQQIIALTSEWKGERTPDGRPKISDQMLERLKNISIEEAWGVLRNKGFQNQYEGDWLILNQDSVMTGRVVTAQYMPLRPDFDKVIKEKGKTENRIGATNSWPIDVLKNGPLLWWMAHTPIPFKPAVRYVSPWHAMPAFGLK